MRSTLNDERKISMDIHHEQTEGDVNNLKVLLVDDYEKVRRSLASFLRRQRGVQIIGEAASGDEAVLQTERLQPDLVLMDLEMPDRGGLDAMREIKTRAPQTRVVILSPHGNDIYRRMAWKHSADGFIDKSSMKQDLLQILLAELERLSDRAVATAA
jgi:DNA-binding NarL/FixJ family response regulator